ncbi:MAG: hypothetical protein WC284_15350 [Candidimonas sp.]
MIYYPLRNIDAKLGEMLIPHSGLSQGVDHDNLGLGYIYYGLTRMIKPKTIVCIGNLYGFVPYMFALAIKHNGFGKITFIDANLDETVDDISWNGEGFWGKGGTGIFSYLGVDVEVIIDKTQNIKWSSPIDICYIDGQKDLDGLTHDWEKFGTLSNYVLFYGYSYLSDGIRIGYEYDTNWHQYMNDVGKTIMNYQVNEFVNQIEDDHISIPIGGGITIVDRISDKKFSKHDPKKFYNKKWSRKSSSRKKYYEYLNLFLDKHIDNLNLPNGKIVEYGSAYGNTLNKFIKRFGFDRCIGYDVYDFVDHPNIIVKNVFDFNNNDKFDISLAFNDIGSWDINVDAYKFINQWVEENVVIGGYYIVRKCNNIEKLNDKFFIIDEMKTYPHFSLLCKK